VPPRSFGPLPRRPSPPASRRLGTSKRSPRCSPLPVARSLVASELVASHPARTRLHLVNRARLRSPAARGPPSNDSAPSYCYYDWLTPPGSPPPFPPGPVSDDPFQASVPLPHPSSRLDYIESLRTLQPYPPGSAAALAGFRFHRLTGRLCKAN
jgi:hypothetical protein